MHRDQEQADQAGKAPVQRGGEAVVHGCTLAYLGCRREFEASVKIRFGTRLEVISDILPAP